MLNNKTSNMNKKTNEWEKIKNTKKFMYRNVPWNEIDPCGKALLCLYAYIFFVLFRTASEVERKFGIMPQGFGGKHNGMLQV